MATSDPGCTAGSDRRFCERPGGADDVAVGRRAAACGAEEMQCGDTLRVRPRPVICFPFLSMPSVKRSGQRKRCPFASRSGAFLSGPRRLDVPFAYHFASAAHASNAIVLLVVCFLQNSETHFKTSLALSINAIIPYPVATDSVQQSKNVPDCSILVYICVGCIFLQTLGEKCAPPKTRRLQGRFPTRRLDPARHS